MPLSQAGVLRLPGTILGRYARHAPVLLAFATIYLVWGSTYLAIAVAVETLPPFLMVAVRMLAAGGVLYGYARWRGAAAFTRAEWGFAITNGALLFLGGYGIIAWAEQRVASGITALLATTAPFWLVLLQWATDRARPTLRTWLGLALGTFGVALLLAGDTAIGAGDALRALGVLLSSLLWAAGTLRASRRRARGSAARTAGAEMLAGGWMLLLAGLLLGEGARVSVAAFTPSSLLALGYLTVFGSIAAFTAYRWLLERVEPSLVTTHAYVNPFVALVLGWLWLDEPMGGRVIVSALAIVGAIALMRRSRRVHAPAQHASADGSSAATPALPRRTVVTAQSRAGRPARLTARTRTTSPARTSRSVASVLSTRVEPRACPADGPRSTS